MYITEPYEANLYTGIAINNSNMSNNNLQTWRMRFSDTNSFDDNFFGT